MVATEKSLANLIPCDSKRASEIGKLNKDRPQTARESFATQKYCNEACIFFLSCPASSTSRALKIYNFIWNKKIRRWVACTPREPQKYEKGKVPCFIKAQPQEVINYFVQLFTDGEEGLIKVIMDLHFRLMLKTQSAKITARELKEAIETSLNVKKGIYGDRQKIEHSGKMEVEAKISITEKIKQYEQYFTETGAEK